MYKGSSDQADGMLCPNSTLISLTYVFWCTASVDEGGGAERGDRVLQYGSHCYSNVTHIHTNISIDQSTIQYKCLFIYFIKVVSRLKIRYLLFGLGEKCKRLSNGGPLTDFNQEIAIGFKTFKNSIWTYANHFYLNLFFGILLHYQYYYHSATTLR